MKKETFNLDLDIKLEGVLFCPFTTNAQISLDGKT